MSPVHGSIEMGPRRAFPIRAFIAAITVYRMGLPPVNSKTKDSVDPIIAPNRDEVRTVTDSSCIGHDIVLVDR